MSCPLAHHEFNFPALPVDALRFWQAAHPDPRHGFFLGSGAATETDHLLYMSVEEPAEKGSSLTFNLVKPTDRRTRLKVRLDPFPFQVPRFVGIFGFDAGRYFDDGIGRLPKKPDHLNFPTAFFGDYRAVVKMDLLLGRTTLYVHGDEERAREIGNRMQSFLRVEKGAERGEGREGGVLDSPSAPVRLSAPFHTFRHPSQDEFTGMVRRAKEHISRGDIYQANLSLRFESDFPGDPVDLYRAVCVKNPSPYACLIKQDENWIVSNSPELLLRVKGGDAATRPIAGTRPRGHTLREDRARQGQLLLSPKERAEHIMLVDLARNDLGRVCRPGTVAVPERFKIERYSHVMHIVSEVRGMLESDRTSFDALKALFPGGTITGCPKIRAIQIIEELEGISRGPFYGSAGYFSWNGEAAFNILIRTALLQKGKMIVQAGAGIVADSRPEREYDEVLTKASALLEAAAETPQPAPAYAHLY